MGSERINITEVWIRYIMIMVVWSTLIWLPWQLDILPIGARVATAAILGFGLGAISLKQLSLVKAYRGYSGKELGQK